MEQVISWVTLNWASVLQIFLAVLGVFSIIAKLTPSQSDDKVLAKIYGIINFFGLTKKA